MQWQHKTVYITGGSSGIGLAAAIAFARLGARPVLLARRPEALRRAKAEVDAIAGADLCRTFELDVAERAAAELVLARAVAECGPPDLLLNSAGVSRPGTFEQLSYEDFDRMIRVNLYGSWNCCQLLLPHMKGRGGHIVNVSSLAGLVGVFGYTAYCASKFGVVGFSEALRAELKPQGIRVSVLCPPDTDTPMLAAEAAHKPPETAAISAAAKVLSPERVVDELLEGLRRNKAVIVVGFDARLTATAKRMTPRLVDWAAERLARKARR